MMCPGDGARSGQSFSADERKASAGECDVRIDEIVYKNGRMRMTPYTGGSLMLVRSLQEGSMSPITEAVQSDASYDDDEDFLGADMPGAYPSRCDLSQDLAPGEEELSVLATKIRLDAVITDPGEDAG